MSDTYRHVDEQWRPGHPDFDKWNGRRPPQKRVKSLKHQARDHERVPRRRLRLK